VNAVWGAAVDVCLVVGVLINAFTMQSLSTRVEKLERRK
jgi:hypothetical protein